MARTKAQQNKKGQRNYGRNYSRGRTGEAKAAADLRKKGYSVKVSKGSRGPADVIARNGSHTRKIQVKRFTSRAFSTKAAARNRVTGAPYNVPSGREVWVYDANGKVWKFRT